ncbi:MAG: trypsin-like peptidase domain-containing protein [Bdellovibrionia bacterium]
MKNPVALWSLAAIASLGLASTFSSTGPRPPHVEESKDVSVLLQASRALNEIAKKANPAVVSINAVKTKEINPLLSNLPEENTDPDLMGIGSGVIVRPDGVVLTNNHVVEGAVRITVTLDEKHKYSGRVIGGDAKTDLALLQIEPKPDRSLPTLEFGDSNNLKVGDWTVAIGSPFGLNRSVTSGIISAVGRGKLGVLEIEDFIQTDAAINPGNSGGPLLNSSGEVVGINTAIFSQSGGSLGIGFAIPSRIASQVFAELLQHGRVIRGWIGLMAQNLDDDLARFFRTPSAKGALITQVVPGGPGAEATLQPGDVVMLFDSTEILNAEHFKKLVSNIKSPTPVRLSFLRNGAKTQVVANIREQPSAHPGPVRQQAGQLAKANDKHPHLGIKAEDIPPAFFQLFGLLPNTGALITEIKTGSPAFEAGLSQGDIVLQVNRQYIHSAGELFEIIGKIKPHGVEVLYVKRGLDQNLFIPLKAED